MTSADHTIWLQVLTYLRERRPDICRQWFEELEPLGVANGVYRIAAHHDARRGYLDRECHDGFEEAIRSVTGNLLTVRFVGTAEAIENGTPAPVVEETREQYSKRQHFDLGDSLVIIPDYTFENFIEGPETRLAYAASRAVSEKPGKTYNPLFIHGGVGLGKTHLLQAICLRIMTGWPDAKIYYVSCEAFTSQFMDAVKAGLMSEFRHRFRDVDVLVIDDIHFLAKLDRSQEEFFHTFNSLYQAGNQIVLSSDAPPNEIPDLEARLVSRFQSGLVVQVSPPCYETRIEIVKQKGLIRGLTIDDATASYIAANITQNIREIEGAVAKLHMRHIEEKTEITPELARASLDHSNPTVKPEITITDIIDAVVDHYGVKLTDLQSKRRQKSIAQPRQLCMFLARRHTRYSLEEIGGYFGGRDHTTVMHAVRTIEQKMTQDDEFNIIVESLEGNLRRPVGNSTTP